MKPTIPAEAGATREVRSTASLSTVVPTFNDSVPLCRCLAALEIQIEPPARVVVCIDGSTDETLARLTGYAGLLGLVLLEHPDQANHGRAAARNLALPHLQGDFVLLVDADMELAPDAVARHLDLLAREPGTVSVGDVIYRNAAANTWARYLATRGKNKAALGEAIRPLDFATGNTAMRSEDLVAVGGFDEGFVGYGGEDTDLGLRLAKERGLRFVFNAEAKAYTTEPKTMTQGLAQLDAFARTNLRRIRTKHPGLPAPYWLDHLDRRDAVARVLLAAMNPLTDRLVRWLEPRSPWALRRRLIDYLVLRTIWRGYLEGPR